ncbi:protein phosphatase methylesterase 1, partial [Striga asiatica]
ADSPEHGQEPKSRAHQVPNPKSSFRSDYEVANTAQQTNRKSLFVLRRVIGMENSSDLTALPEDDLQNDETALHTGELTSAFSSKPDRPPIHAFNELCHLGAEMYCLKLRRASLAVMTSSQKYAPLDWSMLSFALSARIIKEKARVVAMDLRGHGKSSTDNDLDLSIVTLCNDVVALVKTMYGDSPPAIVIVGHSMGGSVAVHIAAKKLLPSLAGLVVVDVVEGTAMSSLIHMQKILSNRVQHFSTVEKAIEWSVKGGSLRNIESARVSIPSTLVYDESRKWYEGLSDKYLSSPVPKLLLLAGTDRLDRALTIGQMQGKFQMVVVRHTGHAIQEDVPDEFADLILNFISRNRIGPHGVEIPGIHTWSRRNLVH